MPRLYVSPALLEQGEDGAEWELDADNAKKVVKVLRMQPGETFVAFDGSGREWDCAIAAIETGGKPRARAVILSERDVENSRRVLISIAQAVPKGDKMDFVLQKGTELGVVEFWPFEAQRSVSRLSGEDDYERATARGIRWRRIVEGAASQCGRADVPVVHALGELSTAVDNGTMNGRCFFLDESPDAVSLREALQRDPLPFDDELPPRVMIIIGPEGGWTQTEREWAERYGAEPIHLGSRILRTETAALVAASILCWEAGEF